MLPTLSKVQSSHKFDDQKNRVTFGQMNSILHSQNLKHLMSSPVLAPLNTGVEQTQASYKEYGATEAKSRPENTAISFSDNVDNIRIKDLISS